MSSLEFVQEDKLLFDLQDESNCLYIPWHSQPFPVYGYGPVVPSNPTDLKGPWIFARKYPKELEQRMHTQWGWRMVIGVGKVKPRKLFKPKDNAKRTYVGIRKSSAESSSVPIRPRGVAVFRDSDSTTERDIYNIAYVNPTKNKTVCLSLVYEQEGKLFALQTNIYRYTEPVRRIMASSLHDAFVVISDNMINWYRYRNRNRLVRKYQAGKRIVDAAWDTNGERLLLLFEDEIHLVRPVGQAQIVEACLTTDARVMFTFDGSVLVSMHGHFYQLDLETGGFVEFSTAFEFGRITLLVSSDAATGTPWLAAFASDKMVGVIDTRAPALPLASWTLDQFTDSADTEIHDLTMANLHGVEYVLASVNGHVLGVPLHYEIVAGHRLVCGRPMLLHTRSSSPDTLQISNAPYILGTTGDPTTNRVYAVYEDGSIGCTFVIPDSLEPQTRLDATLFKHHQATPLSCLDFRRLLPLLKENKTATTAFTVDPLLYGDNSGLYTSFPEVITAAREHVVVGEPQQRTSAVEALLRNWDLTILDGNQEASQVQANEVSENDDAYSMESASDGNMQQDGDYGDDE